jgi:hypothetical protein
LPLRPDAAPWPAPPGAPTRRTAAPMYNEVVKKNISASQEEKQKDSEKVRERFGWLYLHD